MDKPYRVGLVVGKFSPVHLGHQYLLDTAQAQCQELYILSYSQPEFVGYSAVKREGWLRDLYPQAHVWVLDQARAMAYFAHQSTEFRLPANDAPDLVQRRWVGFFWRTLIHRPLDVIFTSESYGDGFAQEMSQYLGYTVQHVLLDLLRQTVPTSGSLIRSDIHRYRDHVSGRVYADFVERICFLGGESSGKSTLAQACAEHWQTQYVPEYGRELWEQRQGQLLASDYLHIAQTQITRENLAAQQAKRYLFCDTSPLTTLFYAQYAHGNADPELFWLSSRPYQHIFLCANDIEFVQDGTREGEHFRDWQYQWYVQQLHRLNWPFTILKGSVAERIQQVAVVLAEKE